MAPEASAFRHLKNPRVVLVSVLILSYSAAAVFAVMSDVSVRGLTVRIFTVSGFLSTEPTTSLSTEPTTSAKIVTYEVGVSVWSTHSLTTSISQVSFTLSVDGVLVGTVNETGASFDPGDGVEYFLTFRNPALDPQLLSSSTKIVLSLTALVSAGFYSSKVTTSDSLDQTFT